MTAMAGSSRTLHQGGQDGWLPKYLAQLNSHGAPTRAMWTDLIFNLILLAMSDYVFVLAVSNCNYLIFNFLNLNAGWIHRIDNPNAKRPWRAPPALLSAGGGGGPFSILPPPPPPPPAWEGAPPPRPLGGGPPLPAGFFC